MDTAFEMGTSVMEGKAAKNESEFKGEQLKRAATASRAAGTRESQEEQRAGRKIQSDAQAQMAAGGGSTTDAGAVKQKAGLKQATDYNALEAIFQSEEKAKGYDTAASAAEIEGKNAGKSGFVNAFSTLLSDDSAMSKFKGFF